MSAQERLAETFRDHEYLAPDANAVLANVRAGTVRSTRRRVVSAVASAAAVVAVLIATPVAVPKLIGRSEPAKPKPTVSYRDVALAPGWLPPGSRVVERELLEPGRKSTAYYAGNDDRIVVVVAENERDAFFDDGPAKLPLPAAERVDVNGRPAAFRLDSRTYHRRPPARRSVVLEEKYLGLHVTWKTSNGLWASVNVHVSRNRLSGTQVGRSDFDPAQLRADVLRIARDTRLVASPARPVTAHRYAFTVGYLPPGVLQNGRILDDSSEQFTRSSYWGSYLAMSLDGTKRSGWDGTDRPDHATTSSYNRNQVVNKLIIEVHSSAPRPKPGPNAFTINGRRAEWADSGAGLLVEGGPNGEPSIDIWGDLSKAEMIKIAHGIRPVDNPNRHESWTAEPVG